MGSYASLSSALDELRGTGSRTPCQEVGSDLWFSEHSYQRRIAAARCTPCPVLDLCRRAADDRREEHHVWGGIDYTNLARQYRNRLYPDGRGNRRTG